MRKRILKAVGIIVLGLVVMSAGFALGGNLRAVHYFRPFTIRMDAEKTAAEHWEQNDVLDASFNTGTVGESSAIKKLEVDVSRASLVVEPHDKAVFEYTMSGEYKKIGARVFVDHDTLTIKTKRSRKNWLPFFSGQDYLAEACITVYVPRGFWFDSVHFSTGAAEVRAEGFNAARSFMVDTGVGEVTIQAVTASNVQVNTGVGEISFKDCVFTDTNMQTGVGELCFQGKLCGSTTIASGIGETALYLDGHRRDYTVNASSTLGSIKIDGENFSNGFLNRAGISGSAAVHTLDIQSSIGEVAVHFNEKG